MVQVGVDRQAPIQTAETAHADQVISGRVRDLRRAMDSLPQQASTEGYNTWETEKGKRQRATNSTFVFADGDKISVQGAFDVNNGQVRFHADADGRYADNFLLPDNPQTRALAALQGVPMRVGLTVSKPISRDYVVSNIEDYDARIDGVVAALPSVNPDVRKLQVSPEAHTKQGVNCLLVGRVTSVMKDGYQSLVTLDIPGQGPVQIEYSWEEPKNSGATDAKYAALRDHEIKAGDIVQAPVRIAADKIYENFAAGTQLVEPNQADRLTAEKNNAAYIRGCQQIETLISTGRFDAARASFAAIRKVPLSPDQEKALNGIVSKMPAAEQPVHYNLVRGGVIEDEVRNIEAAYGVSIEAMNAEQFEAFGKKAVTGALTPRGEFEMSDLVYLYRADQPESVLKEAQVSIAKAGVAALRPVLLDGKDHEFDQKYLLEESYRWMNFLGGPAEVQSIVDILMTEVNNNHFWNSNDGEPSRLAASIMFQGVEVLGYALEDPEKARVICANLPALRQANAKVQQIGENSVEVRLFGELIEKAEKIAATQTI